MDSLSLVERIRSQKRENRHSLLASNNKDYTIEQAY